MIYTSGTTGRAKGAILTQGSLVANCQALTQVWELSSQDVLLHALPLFHIHGLFVASYCTLASAGSMLMLESSDVVVDHLDQVTVFMGVPTHYVRMLASARLTREVTKSMRLFVSGSAPMLRTTHEEFLARTGHEIVERYGMTETGIITSQPLHGARKIGTVGRALPGVSIRVSGAAPGGIEVKGENLVVDYWNRPELRETEFTPDGWFKTGDLGSIDEDGDLEIVGRAKDLIITGGLNVYPKELELVIDAFPGVLECAVIGVPDDDFGEAVTALVVAVDGVLLDESELRARATSTLAPYKVPKRFIVVAELPRNAMGKVEKARLRRDHSLATGDEP
jgi:malonyl-CoA/methylmalonyl-CoA synthetase